MARARIVLGIVTLAFGLPAWARPQCRLPSIDVPACAGVGAPFSSSFCFGDGCVGTGTVRDVQQPPAPFELLALRVQGFLGSRPVGEEDFPVVLLPGETMVAELTVRLAEPGALSGVITWVRGGLVADRDDEDREDDTCTAAIHVAVPACLPDPTNPCEGRTCEAGACVSVPVVGPCGDLCQTGGICLGGACVGGTPVDCSDDQPCTVDLCDLVAGCVHIPGDAGCDDGDPCTTDRCGATGCVHAPRTGACDDGDACTTRDRCRVSGRCGGDPIHCTDETACTDDVCVDGQCEFRPVDALCEASNGCAQARCAPGDPEADRRGCVSQPVGEGEACTDDGRSCTDDLCTAGGCVHVPVDARCTPTGDCSARVCAPEDPAADAAGCAPGPARDPVDGCAEDGDPCSEDACRAGACEHQQVPDWRMCAPVQGAFRKALGLMTLTRGLEATVAGARAAAPEAADDGMGPMLTPLNRVELDLEAAVDALAGRGVVPAVVGTAIPETTSQARSRVALGFLAGTPRSARAFVATVRRQSARAMLGDTGWRTTRRRGLVLLRGTKSLKGELRRLRQVSRTFAR